MSTLKVTSVQHASAASAAITLASDGTAAATLSSLNGGALSGARNRIINGDMRIDQRNAGAAVTSAALSAANQSYFLDRWRQDTTANASFTYQRNAGAVTPPVGFTNYLGVTSTAAYTPAANTTHRIAQTIEGFNVADLAWGTANAVTVTLSFWVRCSVTGTHSGSIQNSNGATRSYLFSYTISAANTWEYKTVVIPGDTAGSWATDNSGSTTVSFNLGTGSGTYGSSSIGWQAGNVIGLTSGVQVSATNGATFYITGVQLEAGSVATPFERRSYGQELSLCQRYYYTHVRENSFSWGVGTYYASNLVATHIYFPVSMRSAPTLDYKTGTNYYGAYSNAAFDAFDAMAIARAQPNGAGIDTSTGTSGTAGHGCVLATNNADSFIAFTAEL